MSRTPPAPAPRLESLESRDVPAFLTGAELVVGADADAPPVVRVLNAETGAQEAAFLAFDAAFSGGVRVATGDVNGDGYPDLVVGAGRGGGPQVKVYDGKTGDTLASFFAYDPSFTGGVRVAVGDLNGDGRGEIITGAGAGGGPQVNVFDGAGKELASGFAYDSGFLGGVRVAAGDLDGDGRAEIVTAPGAGGGPDVRTFQLGTGLQQLRPVGSFFAYATTFTGGVSVAAGDVDGDGRAEIVTGAGPGGGPQVSVFTGAGQSVASFFAFDSSFTGGVRVAAADLTGDGKAEVIAGAGPGGGPQVSVYSLPSTTPIAAQFGMPSDQTTGVFVAGSARALNLMSSPDSVITGAYNTVNAAVAAAKQAAEEAAKQAEQQAQLQQLILLYPYPVYSPLFSPFGYGFPYFGFGPFGYGGLGYGLGGLGFGYPYFGSGLGLGLGLGGLGGLGLGSYYGSGLGYYSPGYYDYGGYGGYGDYGGFGDY